MATSAWEWVGDVKYIKRDYYQNGVNILESRQEMTRSRTVYGGTDFSDASLRQAGTSATSVTASNGGNSVTVTPALGLTEFDCEEDSFNPVIGTNFVTQVQRWVAWATN